MDASETLGVVDAVLRLVADEAPLDLLLPSLAGVVDSAIESTASAFHLPGRPAPAAPLGGEPHTALVAAAVDRSLSTGEAFSLSLPAGTWCSAHVVPVVAGAERVAALVVWSPRPGQFAGEAKAAVDRAVHLAAIGLVGHTEAVALRRSERVDPLTGLANERHFTGVLEAIAAEPDPGPCAVVVLDVDDFAASTPPSDRTPPTTSSSSSADGSAVRSAAATSSGGGTVTSSSSCAATSPTKRRRHRSPSV